MLTKVFLGKRVLIKYLSNGTRTVNFYNSDGIFIGHTPNGEYGVKEATNIMPTDTKEIAFGYGNGDLLYEIDYNFNNIVPLL